MTGYAACPFRSGGSRLVRHSEPGEIPDTDVTAGFEVLKQRRSTAAIPLGMEDDRGIKTCS